MNTKKTYNKSLIMKRAWVIYRKNNGQITWSDALKQSWEIAKNGLTTKDFDAIYKKYYPQVFRWVNNRLFSNSIEVEEITNDVFVKAYKHLENYDVMKAQLNTWLFTIAKNAVIDLSRSKQYKKASQVELIDGYMDDEGRETYEFGSDIMDGQNCLQGKELLTQVKEIIAGFKNSRDRELCTLALLDELSYGEIAEIMDIPLGTVKGTLNRCRAKLQKKIVRVY